MITLEGNPGQGNAVKNGRFPCGFAWDKLGQIHARPYCRRDCRLLLLLRCSQSRRRKCAIRWLRFSLS